jgi:predicted DCC family thiol-disulfide oxidoreductase YuxK
MQGNSDGPVFFYDTGCSVCRRFVELLVNADRRGEIRIAALTGARATTLRERHPAVMAINSAVWLPVTGDPVNQSDAILSALAYVGGMWRVVAWLAHGVPRFLRDRIYRAFAGNRRYFGRFGIATLGPRAAARVLHDTADHTRADAAG